ncbi:MAG: KH domain-containing protein [Candidatus Liptonbacteria bacterium]|nr:KH domain-containing protein [Candidatus Liptonbacteria bacterium]
MEQYRDKEFLEYLVKSIVDHPENVTVDRKVDEMGVLLSLKVNPQDMGQVVGRQGATAKAIRSLLRIVGMKNNARVNLKIEEPDGGTRANRSDSAPTHNGLPAQAGGGPPAGGKSETEQAMEDLNL